MTISTKFNRFYHSAVLNDLYNKSYKIVFKHLKDNRTGGAFTINKYEDYHDLEDLKQLLKISYYYWKYSCFLNCFTRNVSILLI